MFSRLVASATVLTLLVWFAAPARASVECRPEAMPCAHCLKQARAKTFGGLAFRPDCCIVHPAQARPQASNPNSSAPLVPCESRGKLLAAMVEGMGRTALAASVGPSPPSLQLSPPLLC
jgi:hypothetical protein